MMVNICTIWSYRGHDSYIMILYDSYDDINYCIQYTYYYCISITLPSLGLPCSETDATCSTDEPSQRNQRAKSRFLGAEQHSKMIWVRHLWQTRVHHMSQTAQIEKNADRSKRKGQRASDHLNKLSNDSKTKKCAAIKRKNYIWWKATRSLFLPLSDKTHQAFGFGKPTKTFFHPNIFI